MGSRETMHHDFLCRQSAWHYSIAADNVLFFEWFECPVAATLLNIHIFGPRRNERNDFPPFAPVGSPCFKIGNLFYSVTWLLPLTLIPWKCSTWDCELKFHYTKRAREANESIFTGPWVAAQKDRQTWRKMPAWKITHLTFDKVEIRWFGVISSEFA